MKVLITEKPSVAMQFAKVLGAHDRKDGYIEGGGWIITWAVGHLVTLSYPQVYDPKYQTWNLDDLPFLPEKYLYEVIKDVSKQFKIVSKLFKSADVIYNAGDSGREGEYIQRLIMQEAGVIGKVPCKRVWIDSQTDDEIKRGIREAKDSSYYDNLSAAAYERGIEDYAIGINLSRALALKFAYKMKIDLGLDKYQSISVGRVMTCVLAMIVQRENEIRNFRPTDFYKIDALHKGFTSHFQAVKGSKYFESDIMYNASGFRDKKDAEEFLKTLQKDPRLTVTKADNKIEKKNAPLLFNLAELQAECSKRYKINPDETLAVAQSLYEKKMTTYPRTDARVLSSAVAKEIDKNIKGLQKIDEISKYAKDILSSSSYKGCEKTRYTDDSKITDHYAIVPTGETGSFDALTGLEKNVYLLICRRFLSIFMPAAEYKKSEIALVHTCGEQFFASTKILSKDGYLAVTGKGQDDDDKKPVSSVLENIQKGDVIDAQFGIVTATTKPPTRYNSGSMILAMENAGKLIEDDELREQIKGQGIGTSATRAATITKLVSNKYIDLNKKTQVLTPTKIGEYVIKVVSDTVPSMMSPKMTASWEKGLSQIEKGEVSPEKYRKTLEKFVRDSVEVIKQKEGMAPPQIKRDIAGKCPVCGSDLYEYENYYMCSAHKKNDKKSCQFMFSKTLSGVLLPDEIIEQLLNGETTDFMDIDGTNKEGKPTHYTVRITVMKNGECKLDFPKEETEETSIVCPKCAKMMQKGKFKYTCDCGYELWHTVSGKELEDGELNTLFDELITGPHGGFKTKDGVPFDGYLLFNDDKVYVGKTVLNKRQMSKDEYMELMENGKTEVLSGFISGKGSEFSAALKFADGYITFDFGDSPKGSSSKGKKKTGYKKKKTKK